MIENDDLKGYDNLLTLLAFYRDEWKYRDSYFISIFWRYISLSLIVTFFPNLVNNIGFSGNAIAELPIWVFSLAGIFLSLFGAYMTIGEQIRIKKLDEIHKKLMKKLPDGYAVGSLSKDNYEKYFNHYLNYVLCASYLVPIILAIINIFANSGLNSSIQ